MKTKGNVSYIRLNYISIRSRNLNCYPGFELGTFHGLPFHALLLLASNHWQGFLRWICRLLLCPTDISFEIVLAKQIPLPIFCRSKCAHVCHVEERGRERGVRGGAREGPVPQPRFTLFSSIPLSFFLSLTLTLPPSPFRSRFFTSACGCVCVCVWRVRVCVHECVCSMCVHECVCGVCYFVHFTSQTKIFLCPFLLLYRTVSFFCPSRCEPVTRCSWSGSGRSQSWRTSDCPCHRHRHRLVSTKLNSRFAQISAEQEKLSRQKSTQKKPKGANATILLFFSKENCNCVMKLFSKVKEIASVGGDYVCRKPIIRNNSSNSNNNNI